MSLGSVVAEQFPFAIAMFDADDAIGFEMRLVYCGIITLTSPCEAIELNF